MIFLLRIISACLPVLLALQAYAQDITRDERVNFASGFFEQYQPDTALDMVQQIPGFQLDDGDNLRGFGGAAGNILIDGRRPSTKQDVLSAILTRIPARHVERIELIRGNAGAADLQGQSVVANIILHKDAPAAIRWRAGFRRNFNNPQFGPEAGISLSDRWRQIDYNAGFSAELNPRSYKGPERIYNSTGGQIEQRDDNNFRDSNAAEVNLNANTLFDATEVRLNTRLAVANQDGLTTSVRVPLTSTSTRHDELFGDDQRTQALEFGLDAERPLSSDITGKIIWLGYARNNTRESDQRSVDAASGKTTFYREAKTDTRTRENIGRIELDWSGWADHSVQANLELAYNLVDGTQRQFEDRGAGPLAVDVPGANTRVDELRWDALLLDSWTHETITLNYGLGIERSTISSEGDDNRKRSFNYLKPQAQLVWALDPQHQLSMRIAREVAQLDFNEFISSSVFEDDDLALGNTNLRPERTWISELGAEKRFGQLGVVSVTAFYHAITDVQDLMPLTPEFEVPGNIGNGHRLGLEIESTIPLEWTGLTGARLDVKVRWQDSSVTDPVTGQDRVLSGKTGFGGPTIIPFRDETDEYEYVYDVAYRQDFNTTRVAWGWDFAERGERVLFKVNELDIIDESDLELNAFVETTRWADIKVRVEGQNILNLAEERNRTIFIDTRNLALTGIERREWRAREKGFRLFLILTGSF
jgi:hypothetical protein